MAETDPEARLKFLGELAPLYVAHRDAPIISPDRQESKVWDGKAPTVQRFACTIRGLFDDITDLEAKKSGSARRNDDIKNRVANYTRVPKDDRLKAWMADADGYYLGGRFQWFDKPE